MNGSKVGIGSTRAIRVGAGSIGLLLLGALLVPVIEAQAGGNQAGTAIQATATGRMTLKAVWTPHGNSRSPRVKMSALPTIDPADYRAAKATAEHREGGRPR